MTDHHLDLEVKFTEPSEAGEFGGLASVFGETDMMGDQVQRGAFAKSLAAQKRAHRMPLMLWMHDLTAPIGKWVSIRETAQGLAVHGRLLLDTIKGREAYSMLKEKVVDGLSIGFRTIASQRIKTGRLLTELDLAEISLVALPALASARVVTVKTMPRREAAQPVEGRSHVARHVTPGRSAGPIRISSRSVAARAARGP